MLGINENTIEQSAIATMQSLGWDYAYGKTILLGCQNEWRERTGEVILKPLLARHCKIKPQFACCRGGKCGGDGLPCRHWRPCRA